MTEKKVLLKDATVAQLRTFAESNLGIEIGANENKAAILAKVQAAWAKEEITVTEAGNDKQPAATRLNATDLAANSKAGKSGSGLAVHTAKTALKDEDLVRLMIQRTEGPGGADDVPLGCNGKIMLVPRGKIVEIPKRYFESLKNAVKHVHDTLPDGSMNPVPREVPDFPYQLYDAA